ncbi:MAG: hypothetical protein HUJ68_03645 [Clostridia bacterium]|nr:hypothetical protein [Clostridia bacterium]
MEENEDRKIVTTWKEFKQSCVENQLYIVCIGFWLSLCIIVPIILGVLSK